MKRAIIYNNSTSDDLRVVQRYLPSNYSARLTSTNCILIEGEDSHGWTMSDYVLPRLASGNWSARAIADNCEGHSSPFASDDDDPLFCTGPECLEKPRTVGEWRPCTAKYSRVAMAKALAGRLECVPVHYRNVVQKGTTVTFDVAVHLGVSWYEVRMDLSEFVGACGSPLQPGTLNGIRCPASY